MAVDNSQLPNGQLPKGQLPTADDPHDFCREVESYLCRKNDGHLIRIVGPAFEQVCSWSLRGVPIKVALRGIDRYFERYYAKGPRRRPVRVEFCEADVFDVFDEWRRAVGIGTAAAAGSADAEADVQVRLNAERHRASLPAHLDRVIARLTTLRAGDARTLDVVFEELIREIDAARAGAKGLRGDARQAFITRLAALDSRLIAAARAGIGVDTLTKLAAEADVELSPFRARMTTETYQHSREACVDRLIRERLRLPVISFE